MARAAETEAARATADSARQPGGQAAEADAAAAAGGPLLAAAPANLTVGRSRVAATLELQRSHGNAMVARTVAPRLMRSPDKHATPAADQRVVRVPQGTEIYAAPKARGKPESVTEFDMPVALISLQNVELGGGAWQGFWKVSIGGREVYIKQEALGGAVADMLETYRGKDADPSLGNAANGRLRALILKELQPYIGGTPEKPEAKKTLEGTDPFRKIISDTELNDQRTAMKGFTTCIHFMQKILSNASLTLNKELGVKLQYDKHKNPVRKQGYVGAVNTAVVGQDAKRMASLIGSRVAQIPEETGRFAWWEAFPGMKPDRRPKPGDMYVLYHSESRTQWSHIGFILQASTKKDAQGRETWFTVDGGQGSAAKKQEAFETRTRWYDPATNEIEGEPNQDAAKIATDKRRWLLGWVDVDQLVKLPASAAQAASSP